MKKGEATRQHIIEKSAPIFNQQGYGNASLSDLMKATGLEKGGIYRHFTSKEELACEAFDYALKMSYQTKFSSLGELKNGLLKLEGFIRNFVRLKSPISGGCPVYNTAVENDDGNKVLKRRALDAFERWVEKISEFINQAKKEGLLKKNTNTNEMAIFILTSLEGALIAKNLLKQNTPLEIACSGLFQYIENYKP
jgi:TetR/AcrR family transcriptional repressor of nem operon